jgi:uncharacterized protein
MARQIQVFDADSHVLEPPHLWSEYTDPAYRDRVPKFAVSAEGKDIVHVPGAPDRVSGPTLFEKSVGHLGAFGAAWGKGPLDIRYLECQGGYDPHARIAHMDLEGIDAAALFPSVGLLLGGLEEPQHAAAIYRAYNRWLADFCRPYPDRLVGIAMIPLQSVELAIEEVRFARKTLGMTTGFIRPNPYGGRLVSDPVYKPFWQEVQELDFGIAVHTGSAGDMPTIGMDRYGNQFMTRHIVTHTMENMLAMLNIVFCGVCEDFPKIRFGFFEGGGGWVAGWLDRMDRHYLKVFSDDRLTAPPSEIFKRQCWIGFDPAENALPYIVDYIGADRVFFTTDYPHPDGIPDAVRFIRDNAKLSAEAKQLILTDNAKTFFQVG